jgi:signal transduction histidine kinase
VTGSSPERPDIEQALFRAAREALVNVARHAAATRVRVALTGSSDRMDLTVADNGRGLAAGAHRNGHGLSTMKERIEAVRGTMTVTSRPGAGTALVFCWRDDEDAGK